MLGSIVMLMLAGQDPGPTTQPRQYDPDQVDRASSRQGEPTDPFFDRAHVATDDAAFILAAVESSRQGAVDARNAAGHLDDPRLRDVAEQVAAQSEATTRRLEKLAGQKGWRLPQPNPRRDTALPREPATPTRANANFLLNEISYHENILAQYRAQIAGKGDAELKRMLRDEIPTYQKNLELLLTLKP